MKHVEGAHQKSVISWFHLAHRGLGVPAEWLLFAIPNSGNFDARRGALLKSQGLRAGVSDLFLAVPSGGYHGAFFELKRPKGGVLSALQRDFLVDADRQGYCVFVCAGFDEAKAAIEGYLRLRQ